ncbi:MAG: hypothetical protein CMM58_01730 [Rhodospirillaceae bacterium]|nr:hypothetical protein [Rhodospirillaceae bacterium]
MREILETEATGSIAEVYREIGEFYAAPYVSSLFRHLATYPRLLEWTWKILRPALAQGFLQHIAWSKVDVSMLEPLTPINKSDFSKLEIDEIDVPTISNVYETFARVSPVNLVVSGCLQRLLVEGEIKRRNGKLRRYALPSSLSKMPQMLSWDELGSKQRRILRIFETELAGDVFIPGIYRILARWPTYLEFVATELGPKLSNQVILDQCGKIADDIFNSAPEVLQVLRLDCVDPPINQCQTIKVLSAINTYRQTSPQMLVFGTLLLQTFQRS